ncbi:hypothetical protein [Candidatus Berkiella aquae]|uniref:Uncharacterized protein n=1 Tax=Candidatus Berkiella aquae TaxID=295108 RepID=A0A0Q9YKA8_9GAMM|nr:hypothetical protein [Candidatus Berkiella aquae]MCS5711199.1 hypothetical protein [Candidatus Berkiella aquae]
MSLDPAKQAEIEMQTLLDSIPRSKYFPMAREEIVDSTIDSYETTIKRLKAFVRFMSSLNPMQYLKWMLEAFARYVPSKTTSSNAPAEASLSQQASKSASPRKKAQKDSSHKATKSTRRRHTV